VQPQVGVDVSGVEEVQCVAPAIPLDEPRLRIPVGGERGEQGERTRGAAACGWNPGRVRVLRVDAQRYLGPVGPPFLTCYASSDSTHIYAAAYIEGQWVGCDPSTDRQLLVQVPPRRSSGSEAVTAQGPNS
jgi:hypothetical protein